MRISDFFCYFAPLFAISGKTKWLIILHINNLTNEISKMDLIKIANEAFATGKQHPECHPGFGYDQHDQQFRQ